MYHFRNLSVDLLVTPDHQMLAFATGRQYLRKGKIEVRPQLVPAEQIARSAHGWSIPVHARWTGVGVSEERPMRCSPAEWAAFVGLWLAEGHVESAQHGKRVAITQAIGQHSLPIRRILDGLGTEYTTNAHKGGPASKLASERFRFRHSPTWTWLTRLGKSPARFIPRDMLQAEPAVLNALLMGLWLGDGSKDSHTVYTTSSRQLAEDVAELGVKLGFGAVIHSTQRITNPGWLRKYDVTLRSATYYCVHPKRGNVSVIDDWEGEVFCATVPNHTLLVERNGKITWCGNCGPVAAIAFAQVYGRNPTPAEAMQLAKQSGWTPEGGMNGISNEKRLLDKMGLSSQLEMGANWDHIRASALQHQPVILSTPGHYFVIDGFDAKSGAYHVGQSGKAYRGGSDWLTPAQIAGLAGAPSGALFTVNPLVGGSGGQRQVLPPLDLGASAPGQRQVLPPQREVLPPLDLGNTPAPPPIAQPVGSSTMVAASVGDARPLGEPSASTSTSTSTSASEESTSEVTPPRVATPDLAPPATPEVALPIVATLEVAPPVAAPAPTSPVATPEVAPSVAAAADPPTLVAAPIPYEPPPTPGPPPPPLPITLQPVPEVDTAEPVAATYTLPDTSVAPPTTFTLPDAPAAPPPAAAAVTPQTQAEESQARSAIPSGLAVGAVAAGTPRPQEPPPPPPRRRPEDELDPP
jgi:hypothetical protein